MRKIAFAASIACAALMGCGEKSELEGAAAALNAVTVTEYLRANATGGKALHVFFSDNSRIWFGEKEGAGTLRAADGHGPWSEWDKFFNTNSSYDNVKAYDDSVVVISTETNDFYNLIGRSPRKMTITYYCNPEYQITGILITGQPDTAGATDRFDEAVVWLREQHPDELSQLMPEDEIIPSLDNAVLWKKLLNEWRSVVDPH